jgi:hypothetical protein
MVAYSFHRRFVSPILVGLGRERLREKVGDRFPLVVRPKRQTIRADRIRRHAMPGDRLQLYCGLRTKTGFKIGDARCTKAAPITLCFEYDAHHVRIGLHEKIDAPALLDAFAMIDGFESWADLREFWRIYHPTVTGRFRGTIIYWEPITQEPKHA